MKQIIASSLLAAFITAGMSAGMAMADEHKHCKVVRQCHVWHHHSHCKKVKICKQEHDHDMKKHDKY